MTTKKRSPLQDLPPASSSDEDEISGAESEEEASSDDEETIDPAAKPSSSAAAAAKESSDSESGSESETDSDSESNPPPTQGSVKSSSAAKPKKKETALPLPAAKSGAKRPSEGTSREAKSKRAKKATSGDEEKKPVPAFQRLWPEEDEITILQGMIDFKADKGKSPYQDMTAFYDFIKGSISFVAGKNRFMDKVRSLKKKYMNKENPTFTKPHEQDCYKLSKHIWGSDGLALESAVKSNRVSSKKSTRKLDPVKTNGKQKAVDVEDDDVVADLFVGAIARFGVDESFLKQWWSVVPVETKKKIEEKVKVLHGEEIEFLLHKTEFASEVTSMIFESTKNMPVDM
ncbi:unnamed protein product [Microthlaspi erraticum]|uniref:Uncharacterized protein n=1 Tax=Microthlaspi erraticum TaxID=1685480 RepID=A0A6D2J6I8_9BRAS|nr:unnamed protein product [Microthlaspi erraticum]